MFPKFPDFTQPTWSLEMLWWIFMMGLNIASVIFTGSVFLIILSYLHNLFSWLKNKLFPKKCVHCLQKVCKCPSKKDF